MAFRQAVAAFRQGAEPAHAGRQAAAQEFGVARAGDTVGEHAGKRQAGPVGGQAVAMAPKVWAMAPASIRP